MAADVWRWSQVHRKWLPGGNVKASPRDLHHDRDEPAPHSQFSSRSSSFSATKQDCQLQGRGEKPSRNARRWQGDGCAVAPPCPQCTDAPKSRINGRPLSVQYDSCAALRSLPRDLGLGLPDNANACPQEGATDVGKVWPQSRPKRPVRWQFQETNFQNNCSENDVEGETWVTVFSGYPVGDNTGGGTSRFSISERNQVLQEFQKCGTIVDRVFGPDGANWVQIQYQSLREAGQALMKCGMRLKGGLQVDVRRLDERQRKQLLLDTISKHGNHVVSQSSTPIPMSSGAVDLDAPKEQNEAPPKSSISKFVDLVFDCERKFQISPAGYIIPIQFQPGLHKELFKSKVHHCDAFVTPLCDPVADQPVLFEYPRNSVHPCEYAQNMLEEHRLMVEEERCALPPTFRCSSASQQRRHNQPQYPG